MLIRGNMTLDYLARKKVVSNKLYRFLESYSVNTLDDAMTLCTWLTFPPALLDELNVIKNNINDSISILRDCSLTDLFLKGIISKRLYNCLEGLGFKNIRQVLHIIRKNGDKSNILLKKRNFGLMCLDEIDEIISFWKYYDIMIIDDIDESMQDSCNNNKYSITLSTKLTDLHNLGLISVRLFNCLNYLDLFTLGDVVELIKSKGSIGKLLSIRNFGKKSLTELQDILCKLELGSLDVHISETQTKDEVNPINDFLIQYTELIKDETYKSLIENYYKDSKSNLSARLVHILDANFDSLLEVVAQYFTGINISDLRNCGKKTYDELNIFVRNLYDYISSLFTQDSVSSRISLIRNTYSFLSDTEIEFIFEYQKRKSHLPMFYILYHYLTKSNSRFERIFCRYYGLGRESENLTEISVSLNITRERCRQLIAGKKIKEESLITSEIWNYYNFLDSILLYNNYDFNNLMVDEGLEHLSKFSFIGLCSLVKDVRVCKINRTQEYYLSENFYNSFNLKDSLKDIESTLNKRCTEDIRLPLSVFIDSYWLKEPTFETSVVEDIIIYILKEDYGIELGKDKVLYIQQNAIDRSGEIYKIIEEYGKPMHISLIRETLISRYPELSDLTIEQVRSDMYKHPHIEPLGKLSTYAIDKWELYTGTIRDLLYDILSRRKEPMHIDELYNEVSLVYSNTSIKSITSSMVSDNLQRFVRFVGSYYGVTGKIYNEEYVVWDAEAFSRKNFDERIIEFEAFLKSHHHLPRYNDDNEAEAALSRWYRRVKASDASITSEQQKRLSDLLDRNSDYLVTATEYSFYRYCEEFKAFVEDNMEFPTLETDSAKYGWFSKHKKNYQDYEDRRKMYFEDLIEFLYTYGFEV